ncbi:MAG: PhoX family protein [Acidobacteria bacterium]|nr:PhoX family protein [Acidobacteriota bacterium]
MSKPINRRNFLSRTVQTTGVAFAMQGFVARGALAASGNGRRRNRCEGDYGELVPTVSENTGETLLALPEGFKYNVFGRTGTIMSDGRPTPPAHDGMAAFETHDRRDNDDCDDHDRHDDDHDHDERDHRGRNHRKRLITLVRNHEVSTDPGVALDPTRSYDPRAGGGTTTLIIDAETRLPVRDFLSLSGTHNNCAGGATPWGSWITCEENVEGIAAGFSQPHGYVFDVSARSTGLVDPTPIKDMGRFVHEAIAVDPQTGIIYETEDRNPQCGFYRYIPNRKNKPAAGGRLQMLAVSCHPNYDTRTGQMPFKPLRVIWVDIDNPDPANAETDSIAVFKQGLAAGGAIFARLEGAWYGDGSIFFISTNGGNARLGQVWKYKPRGHSGGQLSLIFESPGVDVLDSPDNICVTPGGGLILCEDGGGVQYMRGLTQQGEIFNFALNVVPGFTTQEFAGATFSPDGETLFANIQTPGITFAIWGPWEDGVL